MAHRRRRLNVFLLLFFLSIPVVFLAALFFCTKTLNSASHIFFKGTIQETPVYYLSGRDPKPVLLVFAGIHGDESAGYLTADRYLNLKLRKGTIILVPRLNSPAVHFGTRGGFTKDMNRLFDLTETAAGNNPDIKTVNLAKHLINQADYVLNLHQGTGFYSPVWVNNQRNPLRWGQANVIDAPTFNLPDGRKMELEKFARNVARASNTRISNFTYFYLSFQGKQHPDCQRRVPAQGTAKIADLLCAYSKK